MGFLVDGSLIGNDRTWVITIYRQILLPRLDFTDMTYTGVQATILSGLEPAVAIALACIPLMRPLFRRKSTKNNDSRYAYNSSKIYSKKSGHDTFSELVDDNDDSSQVQLQLQPMEPSPQAVVASVPQDDRLAPQTNRAIVVEKSWEIRRS